MSNALKRSRLLFRQAALAMLAAAPAYAATPAKPVFGARLATDGHAMITTRDGKDRAVMLMNPSLSQVNGYADCEHGHGAHLAVEPGGNTTVKAAMRPDEVSAVCKSYRVQMGPQ